MSEETPGETPKLFFGLKTIILQKVVSRNPPLTKGVLYP